VKEISMKYGLSDSKTRSVRKSDAPKRIKVMVALQGFGEEEAAKATTAAGGGYAAKRAAYGALKEQARERQRALLVWLDAEKGSGSYRRVSAPTAFGTFTLEVSEELLPLLERAPGVAGVIPTEGAPMFLLNTSPATSGK
jgi:hypothetical protein